MGDDLQELLGRRIARFRKASGMTQEQLGDRLSVALETISRMERGVNAPSIRTLGKSSKVLRYNGNEGYALLRGRDGVGPAVAHTTSAVGSRRYLSVKSDKVLRSSISHSS